MCMDNLGDRGHPVRYPVRCGLPKIVMAEPEMDIPPRLGKAHKQPEELGEHWDCLLQTYLHPPVENPEKNVPVLVIPHLENLASWIRMDCIIKLGCVTSRVVKPVQGKGNPVGSAAEGLRIESKDIHISWLAPDKKDDTVALPTCPGI